MLGILLVGIVALTDVEIGEDTLAVTMLALGTIALVFGAVVAVLAAYATVHPIRSIRAGLRRVREGELEDAEVRVWDTTEMGLLQAGFNDMVTGLRERERIRDLFGRQVGEEVAERAMNEQTKLGGEVRDVAVLFVDLVGSTALAAARTRRRSCSCSTASSRSSSRSSRTAAAGSTSSRATPRWRSSARRWPSTTRRPAR